MIKGVGVDIVDISRIEERIANKVLSSREIEMFNFMNQMRKKEFLAGRFAIKEALFKAGLKIPFSQMDVRYNEDGSIYLENYSNIKISISHEREYAIGYAIIEH